MTNDKEKERLLEEFKEKYCFSEMAADSVIGSANEVFDFFYSEIEAREKQAVKELQNEKDVSKGAEPMKLSLYNRADGVDGHYCVGRLKENGFTHEYWTGKDFSGFGRLYESKQAAEETINALEYSQAQRLQDNKIVNEFLSDQMLEPDTWENEDKGYIMGFRAAIIRISKFINDEEYRNNK